MLVAPGRLFGHGGGKRFDFFVDSALGSDSNSGMTKALPKKTLAAAATAVGSATNKRIALKAGSLFYNDTFVSSANGIAIGVYGGSATVVIDCAATIPAGNFTLASGQSKTYQASITVASVAVGITFVNAFENYTTASQTAALTAVTSIANCEATAGSFYWADNFATNSGGAGTLYIHATDDSNPAINGKVYEYSNQAMAIGLTATTGNLTIIGPIECRRQCHGGGSVQMAAPGGGTCTLSGVTTRLGNRHNCIVTAPCVVSSCTFVDTANTLTIPNIGTAGMLVINQSVGSGQTITLNGNSYLSTIPQTSAGCALSHTSSGSYGAVVTSNETMLATAGSLASGYAFTNVASQTVNNLTATNASVPIGMIAPTTINGGKLKGGTAKTAMATFQTTGITATINGGIFVADTLLANHGVLDFFTITGCTLNLNNATVFHGANAGSLLVGCIGNAGAGNTLNMNGCTLGQSSTPTRNILTLDAVPASMTYTGDHNTFADNSYANAFYNNGNENFAAWQLATGQDVHSVETGYIASPL